ncbi:MAG: neutral/alkaline non-lysosomal ceramidase N-terminal domain-containing protein [Clostridia bacterium]|jgi:neutral ceramidase|nr:hypothetical protein [Clostridiaceae bacterium]
MIIGTAKEMVTPHVLMKMGGYAARTEPFEGIHDDLYVRSCLLKNEDKQIVIISYDIIHFNYCLNKRIQDYLCDRYGVKKEEVLISYSHTHAGPAIKHYHEDPENEYTELENFLFERTRCCIDKMFLNLFQGDAYYAKTTGDWNVNRRKKVNGNTVMAPNYEDIKDRELWILILKDNAGKIRGIFYNYSCHAVTLGATMYISSEFPGRINQLLDAAYYGCVSGFLQGSAGNMRPLISAKGSKFSSCSFDEVDQMAVSIFMAIKNVIERAEYKKIDPVFDAVSFVIPAVIDPLPKEFFEQMAETRKAYKRTVENYDTLSETANIHAGIVKMTDDLYFAYMGGEICYEVKQIVQEVFEGKDLFFLGYHEALTYIPSDKIIEEGGYEGKEAPLLSGFKGPFKKGIDETIRKCFQENYERLQK